MPPPLIRTFGVTIPPGFPLAAHGVVPPFVPDWHQLVHATQGVLTVTTDDWAWVVPPQRALWLPAGTRYKTRAHGETAFRMLYVPRGVRLGLAAAVYNVNPLLRELIVRANQMGALDPAVGAQRRLAAVILDELRQLRGARLELPLPADPRAVKFARQVMGAGAIRGRDVAAMARAAGASIRTLERLFAAETQLSLGQWVRRGKLQRALRLLASGVSVSETAWELGYESVSAFIGMFRREMGQTPGEFGKGA